MSNDMVDIECLSDVKVGIVKGIIKLKNDSMDEDRVISIESALCEYYDAEVVQDYGHILQELDEGELDFELEEIAFVVFKHDGQNYLLFDHQEIEDLENIEALELDVDSFMSKF